MIAKRVKAAAQENLPQPPTEFNRTIQVSLLGLLAATVVTFSSTFHFGWVYDDPPQIPQNPNLEWSRLGFLFSHQLWASTAATQARFYRPLLTVWFLINKTLFGLNPRWFHATTVLAHAAAAALAFFVARAILRDAGSALFAAAIFALHPLQVEAASWISAVNDPLAAILCFASFLAYREALNGKKKQLLWWIFAGIFFLLALFAKEVSIVLPGIILTDLLTGSRSGSLQKNSALRLPITIYAAIATFWLALRAYVLSGAGAASAPVEWTTILCTAPKIFLFNLYRALVPVGLSPQYDFHLIDSPASLPFLLTLFALLALISIAFAVTRRNSSLYVAYALIVLPILPTLNLRWMNQNDFIHDRYMYLPTMGVALLAGSAYGWIRNKWPDQQLLRPLAAALVLILAFVSATQSQYWANDLNLFSRAVARAPGNEWAQLNYGSALAARGKFAEAAPHFVHSYELNPGWRAADFAGFAYQQTNNLAQAETWFTTASQLDPSQAAPWFGLGRVRLQQHDPQGAIPYLKKAIELAPSGDGFHYELGQAFAQASQFDSALDEYKAELQLHPSQTGAQRAIDQLQAGGK